ncbi:hypothetical protein CK203_064250 [Vitis vinifera]|uniref:CCHC-type domain-containing protein n=1 Tax=Vitis vinifera TaxID=29760 RepID=A0A438G3T9_VITVI|nr:hypothetical protein CK203_064250 [Vitis vinifera]
MQQQPEKWSFSTLSSLQEDKSFSTKCWWRPDVKCNKCGKQGHVERICKNQQQEETSAAVDYCQEEQLFAATCFANKSTSESWLVDSGCTNHMTNNQDLFRELDRTTISKVRIGNGEYIPVKGKGTVAIESQTGLKLIYDVLFVPDIDQNLLSVGQLVEKEFKVYFEDRNCIIKDAEGKEVFNIKMKGKSFALNLLEDEHTAILQQDSTTMFWDRRVEHFHHDDVLYMKKNQIAEGLPDLEKDLPICATCQYGKQTKLPFPKKISWRATQTDVGSFSWASEANLFSATGGMNKEACSQNLAFSVLSPFLFRLKISTVRWCDAFDSHLKERKEFIPFIFMSSLCTKIIDDSVQEVRLIMGSLSLVRLNYSLVAASSRASVTLFLTKITIPIVTSFTAYLI